MPSTMIRFASAVIVIAPPRSGREGVWKYLRVSARLPVNFSSPHGVEEMRRCVRGAGLDDEGIRQEHRERGDPQLLVARRVH
jgi:hypothetical protein